VISALDGLVAFATLESYGVVDARNAAGCDLALERRLRARRRAAARLRCAASGATRTPVLSRRAAPLTGQR